MIRLPLRILFAGGYLRLHPVMVKAATDKKHKLKGYVGGFESAGKKTT
jgi:hypothetical protein